MSITSRELEEFMTHNPMVCRGDGADKNCDDDPCWLCITWAFSKLDALGVTGLDEHLT